MNVLWCCLYMGDLIFFPLFSIFYTNFISIFIYFLWCPFHYCGRASFIVCDGILDSCPHPRTTSSLTTIVIHSSTTRQFVSVLALIMTHLMCCSVLLQSQLIWVMSKYSSYLWDNYRALILAVGWRMTWYITNEAPLFFVSI